MPLISSLGHSLACARTTLRIVAHRRSLTQLTRHMPSMATPTDEILKHKYPAKAHAKRVVELLKANDSQFDDKSILYVEAAHSKMWPNSDQEAPLRQDRFFFYLSGCPLPDCRLIYDVAKGKSTLFIPPIEPDEVIWSGLPLGTAEAVEKFDVDEVRTTDETNATLQASKGTVYAIDKLVSDGISFKSFGSSNMTALREAIEEARVVKDEFEVAMTKKANEVSAIAHKAVLAAARTANNERQLAAIFVERCTANGCFNQAYSPIVASGTDAATLHYVHNNKNINEGTLNLLLDAGAEYSLYAADVTRTFPINGKFTPESRSIYNLVLQMQTECMNMLKPGVRWDDVHLHAHKVAVDGLLKLRILKGSAEDIMQARTSAAFFPHGLGHFLGMDTHDTGGRPNYKDADRLFRYLRVRRELPAGSIITVEPGVYFCRFIIEPYLKDPAHQKFIDAETLEKYWAVGGVRIEDDVLITASGHENLTAVPKAAEEIEALMAAS